MVRVLLLVCIVFSTVVSTTIDMRRARASIPRPGTAGPRRRTILATMDEAEQDQGQGTRHERGRDVVVIRTDAEPTEGPPPGDDRATRRLGRLPEHATAPVWSRDSREPSARGTRIAIAVVGTGLAAWGGLVLTGVL